MKFLINFILFSSIILNSGVSQEFNDSIRTIKEGNDFATQTFGNPWDMNDFADISQHLNHSGTADLVTDVVVENGIFSGKSTSVKDAYFFPLYPGYGYRVGITGEIYPVQSNKYKCLYLSMKIDSSSYDWWQIFWFENLGLNAVGNEWGSSKGFLTKPYQWNLYKVDLSKSENYGSGTSWGALTEWQGIRIDPTVLSDTQFSVDWVRLTDCVPVNLEIRDLPINTTLELFLVKNGYEINIEEFTTSTGTFLFDVQGIEPGVYDYRIKSNNQVVKTESFEVVNTPTVKILSPSQMSGKTYQFDANEMWNMDSSDQVFNIKCLTPEFSEDKFKMTTQSGQDQPSNCATSDALRIPDPRFNLKLAQPVNTSTYRYLNIRMYNAGPWQNVPEGYVMRWVWSIQGTSGRSGYRCHYVSNDIPLDVGWITYSIDLYDPYNGLPEDKAGECPNTFLTWLESGTALELRLDPNENITGNPLYQEIDWISLNEVDRAYNDFYRIKLSFNKDINKIKTIKIYATSNLSNPKQRLIHEKTLLDTSFKDDNFSHFVYLPLVVNNYFNETLLPNEYVYHWRTFDFSTGDYYICVESIDDVNNQTIFCSQAPVRIP